MGKKHEINSPARARQQGWKQISHAENGFFEGSGIEQYIFASNAELVFIEKAADGSGWIVCELGITNFIHDPKG